MISDEQLEELDNLLGKCLRLSISIEFTVNLIYCNIKTAKEPVLYQDENFNVYANKKFNKLWKKAEQANFDISLKELEKLDKNHKIFTEIQYNNLHLIRKERNKILHETTCPYLNWKANHTETEKEYDKDIKKLRKYISFASQYDQLTMKVLNKILEPKDCKLSDCIVITDVKKYKI